MTGIDEEKHTMEGEPELEARKLAAKAKEVARDGKLKLSLTLFREAYQLFPTEKIKGRITKLQVFIKGCFYSNLMSLDLRKKL